jgi:hypothetical protein
MDIQELLSNDFPKAVINTAYAAHQSLLNNRLREARAYSHFGERLVRFHNDPVANDRLKESLSKELVRAASTSAKVADPYKNRVVVHGYLHRSGGLVPASLQPHWARWRKRTTFSKDAQRPTMRRPKLHHPFHGKSKISLVGQKNPV